MKIIYICVCVCLCVEIKDWKNPTKCEKVDKPKHRLRIQLIFRLYLPKKLHQNVGDYIAVGIGGNR